MMIKGVHFKMMQLGSTRLTITTAGCFLSINYEFVGKKVWVGTLILATSYGGPPQTIDLLIKCQ